jgi:phage gp29-like protein
MAAPDPIKPDTEPAPEPKLRVGRVARLSDIPANAFSVWTENVRAASEALLEMQRLGHFRMAALLADSMLEDDRISGVLSTRVNALLGCELELQPKGDKRRGQSVADEIADGFDEMFQREQLAQVVRWGLLLGLGVAERIWSYENGRWSFKLKTWHPQFIYWRWDTRSFWVSTQDGQVEIPEDGGRGRWLVFAPFGYYRGWNYGLIRPLKTAYLVRQLGYRDWARYSEVHGTPIKKAIVPPGTTPEDRSRFMALLGMLGSEAVVELVQDGDSGQKFDLELLEAQANTWQAFEGLVKQADASIAIAVLGQNLTTEVGGGSRAAATVHDSVRHDILDLDAKTLGAACRATGLVDWAKVNLGDESLAPLPVWQTEPPADQQKAADTLQKLGGFLGAVKASGAPVDVRALLEQMGVPTLTEAQQQAAEKKRAEQAQAIKGQPEPQGDLEDGEPEEPAGEQLRLSQRAAHDGQAYADDVARYGVKDAARVLEPDLAQVLHQVQLAASPDDLKQRLLRLYKGVSPETLQQELERAQVMAELDGRHSAL